jgi:hypothetical protein
MRDVLAQRTTQTVSALLISKNGIGATVDHILLIRSLFPAIIAALPLDEKSAVLRDRW